MLLGKNGANLVSVVYKITPLRQRTLNSLFNWFSGPGGLEIETGIKKYMNSGKFSAPGLDSENVSRILDPKNCKWLKMQF